MVVIFTLHFRYKLVKLILKEYNNHIEDGEMKQRIYDINEISDIVAPIAQEYGIRKISV
jgi:hypothetical protein